MTIEPALLGVGYIIGPRIGSIMCAGGVLAYLVLHEVVGKTPRTDQDLSMKFVIGGVIALLLMIIVAPQLHLQWNLLGALLIVAIGFLFTTVSSHLTGEIGSTCRQRRSKRSRPA